MNMGRRFVGFSLILFSITLAFFNTPNITGAVIGEPLSNSLSFVSAICFVLGLILAHYTERRNYALEVLKHGKYVEDTRELRSIAREMGYNLDESHKEGTRVLRGDEIITVIPHHRRIEGRGTAKSILKALASGESSFRRRSA